VESRLDGDPVPLPRSRGVISRDSVRAVGALPEVSPIAEFVEWLVVGPV
jgi:hypothetical protein